MDGELTDYVRRLIRAAQARKAGLPPASISSSPRLPFVVRDFDAELAHLIDLARIWPQAKAAFK
ncbi:hypothetical protein [Nocardia exalbida]|uniref:hypothetical protein n=1 Tax=Nocardia exalbida TaxID=290231 RepID=UPI000593A0F7|nr:hypothetical protein [Nocardia exalbida]